MLLAAIRTCPLAAMKKTLWPSRSVTGFAGRCTATLPADYQVLEFGGISRRGERGSSIPASSFQAGVDLLAVRADYGRSLHVVVLVI
jgi:hypothetical protein